MNVTIEEFQKLIELANYYATETTVRYNNSFTEHLIKQTEEDLKFRAFVKNHYPEALVEWHALNKIGE